MWRDCRKWHPKTIKVCFRGTQGEGFTLKPPKSQMYLSSENILREVIQELKRQLKKGTIFVFISRVTIIKCMLFSEMFLWKVAALWVRWVLSFFGRAAVDEVRNFSNPIWESTALITRLNFQFSHRYAHKHTHTQNPKWGCSTKQSGSETQKHMDKKERQLLCEVWEG